MKLVKNPGLLRAGAAAAPLVITTIALAQSTLRQPKIDTSPSPVVGYTILAVLSGIVLAISLYPSKRAHTDI